MRSSALITVFLSAIVVLAITHILALEFSLYWRYLWFDIPMHILGGACAALSMYVLGTFFNRIPRHFFDLAHVLAFVVCIGVGWEVFEIMIDIPQFEPDFYYDMWFDLSMDVLGGIVGYHVGSRIIAL